jgi:hypothetical protein
MNRETVRHYLDKSLGEGKYSGQGLKFNCPKPHCQMSHNKYNLEVNLINGSSRYLLFHCWACHYKGHLKTLFRDYAISDGWMSIKELHTEATPPPEGYISVPTKELPKTIPYYLSPGANFYLKEVRNLHDLILIERKVLFCYAPGEHLFNKIVFPFYEDGMLIGYSTQDLTTKEYRNHRDLNFVPYREFINPNYPLIVTEGIYDSFSVPNAVPMLGTNPCEELYKFGIDKKIILALDKDVALETKKEIADKFYFYGAKLVVILSYGEYEDLNEWRVKNQQELKTELKIIFDTLNDR